MTTTLTEKKTVIETEETIKVKAKAPKIEVFSFSTEMGIQYAIKREEGRVSASMEGEPTPAKPILKAICLASGIELTEEQLAKSTTGSLASKLFKHTK